MTTRSRESSPSLMTRLRTGRGSVALVSESFEHVTGGIDGWLLTAVAALCAFGLVMVYSASYVVGYTYYNNANYFFERQVSALVLGIGLMVVAARVDYHKLRTHLKKLVLLTLALMILVLLPHIGSARNGAQRWFQAGPISIQPSAIAALVSVIGFARWLSDRAPHIRTWRGVRDYSVVVGALLVLILLERDLGTAIVAGGVAFVLLLLAGGRKRHLGAVLIAASAVGWALVHLESYRSARLSSWLNPFNDPLGTGYQPVQSLFGLGRGGWLGVGLGNSIEKYNWLPEAHTDFIFAIIGEELGLIGTLCVVGAFLFLGWRGMRAALRAPDNFGVLLAGGITAWVCIQAFINIAAVTVLIPTTGIPLPFVSYGGTDLVMILVAMGILCNVSAQGRRQGEIRRAHFDRWRGHGWPSDARPGRRTGTAAR